MVVLLLEIYEGAFERCPGWTILDPRMWSRRRA